MGLPRQFEHRPGVGLLQLVKIPASILLIFRDQDRATDYQLLVMGSPPDVRINSLTLILKIDSSTRQPITESDIPDLHRGSDTTHAGIFVTLSSGKIRDLGRS